MAERMVVRLGTETTNNIGYADNNAILMERYWRKKNSSEEHTMEKNYFGHHYQREKIVGLVQRNCSGCAILDTVCYQVEDVFRITANKNIFDRTVRMKNVSCSEKLKSLIGLNYWFRDIDISLSIFRNKSSIENSSCPHCQFFTYNCSQNIFFWKYNNLESEE